VPTATATDPVSEAAAVAAAPRQLFVGGRWRDGSSGATLPVEDPSTGTTLAEVADATDDDAEAALAAAHQAFARWRHAAPRERSDVLRRACQLMTERSEQLATLMTLEMGKPLAEARGEVAYAAAYLRWYAEEAVRIDGRFATAEGGAGRVLTMREPVGPCLLITPWNFPLAMGTRKVAPALAAGCTCVVKPAKQTPLSMLAFAQILEQAGAPAGVVNVLVTSRSGGLMERLIRDPRVRKLSFTGSTEVGRALVAQGAEQLLRTSMELGGNAPFLVFEDADLDAAVDGALTAKMRNGGQACTSANRFLVHASVAREFAGRLAARLDALRVGRGIEPDTEVGPLIDEGARASVHALVRDAVERGAELLTGGRALERDGWFYAPTVLSGVPHGAALLREEIFGPVAPVATFSTDEEAVAAANDTVYGLAAYVFTRDLDRAFRVVEGLETGMVGLNQGMVSNAGAPFGGVKHSGFGREGGPEGLGEYLETKYVAINAGIDPIPVRD
jgi:succinate-semialdehyde dehydrogenase / glutarate-semialdehyde dehydrogenase